MANDLPILLLAAALTGLGGAGPVAAFSPDRQPLVTPAAPRPASPTVPLDGAPFTPAPPDVAPLEDGFPAALPDDLAPPPGDPPPVFYGDADLPDPVRSRRADILAAARTGDPEALRPLIDASGTAVSAIGGGDPIDILRAQSGDPQGIEILAILDDVLAAGWVHLDAGTPRERYVWPYFAEFAPDWLDAPQMVEVYRVLTAGDFEEMQAAGTYVFYRVEIAPDGRWLAFQSGE